MDTYDRSTVAPKCWYSQGGSRKATKREKRAKREEKRREGREGSEEKRERREEKAEGNIHYMPSLIHSQADSFSGEFYPRLQHTPSKPPP